MYSTDNVYPSPQPSYSDTYDWSQDTYFSPAPTPDPNSYIQTQSGPIPAYGASPSPAPAPAPPKEKRHKSRSRRHHEPPAPPQQYSPPSYAPPPTQSQSQPQRAIPQPPTRVVRILTLLIEDKRQYHDEENENLLTEVRVPLRPADPGDVGMWADAQDVSEELQKGPSRIDGACFNVFLHMRYGCTDGLSQAERRYTRCGESTSSTSCGRLRTGRTCVSRRT